MKARFLIVAMAAAVLMPCIARGADRENTEVRTVRSMTIQDVIDLARSNVGDDVIESQIDAAGVVFKLTVQDILDLKKAGVSDRVITYMINTGKEGSGEGGEKGTADDGYHSSMDSRYRDYDYDPNWNVYLSWGYGRYYDPWYYTWWPDYSYYYYPLTCLRPYWPYYPYYRNAGHYGYRDRTFRDGRHVYGRGAERDMRGSPGGIYRPGPSQNGREFKGGDRSGRGAPNVNAPERGSSGRTMKSPTYGGRGNASPPPSRSGSNPPPPSSSGRTIKKS